MITTGIREQINQYLDGLSSARLQLVAEFLANLVDKESEEATQQLLDIPEFIESFERGKKDIAEGRMANWRTIKELQNIKYTIVIQWSDEDQCYVVQLPEFEDVIQPCTHGDTYEQALKNAQEVLELLIESALEEGEPLPKPKTVGQSFQIA